MAAILAANPHNTQPWLFQVTPSQISLFADRSRSIGSIDPFLREMHMGLGCALENLLLAATANNYTTQVSLLPDASNENLVAQIALTPGNPTLDALNALNNDANMRIFWFNSPTTRKPVGDLIIEATKAIVADKT